MVPFNSGEKWYFRMIILNRPFTSFVDAKTYGGHTYGTFQECAFASNFVKDGEEVMDTFRQALPTQPPKGRRMLFAVLTLQGYPTLLIFNDLELRTSMMDIDMSKSHDQLYQLMLEDIDRRLAVEGKSMGVYGLPSPIRHITELDAHKLQSTPRKGWEVFESFSTA